MAQIKTYTVAEFEQYTEAFPDRRFELVDGEIIEMPPPEPSHNFIVGQIYAALLAFVMARSLGWVFSDSVGYYLSPQTMVIPDASYISTERQPDFPKRLYVAPELAVEVVSPSNTAREMRDKVELYFQYDTLVVWVVYPTRKEVDVYTRAGDRGLFVQKYTVTDTLKLSELLPGFELRVDMLFPPLS